MVIKKFKVGQTVSYIKKDGTKVQGEIIKVQGGYYALIKRYPGIKVWIHFDRLTRTRPYHCPMCGTNDPSHHGSHKVRIVGAKK